MTLALSATVRALLSAALLVVVVIIAALVLTMIRRRLLKGEMETTPATLSLHEIRAMRQRGEISEDEFQQLRSAALAGWGVSTKTESAGADSMDQDTHAEPSGRTENLPPPAPEEER